MRFADYFGRAFVAVSASQFPWAKMFKDLPVSKMVDVSFFSVGVFVISLHILALYLDGAQFDCCLWNSYMLIVKSCSRTW
jgi:hypothetical protein